MIRADLSLYLVTDAALCGDRGVVQTVAEAVAGGATVVQLRDKTADDAALLAQLAELARVIDGRAALVINDRLDIAVAARQRGIRVDGVHLGQTDGDVLGARSALGPDAIVGLTANRPEHFAAVAALPAGTVDYLGVGVIHPTTTKAGHPPVQGVAGFAKLAAAARDAGGTVPCVAIGGIGLTDVAPLRAAGAAGVAVVSAICAASDPRATAVDFRRAWEGARGGTPAASPAVRIPRVLSIAGSDPSGGAGIQADLKSIAATGGYGMAAITALTAQNTRGVTGVHVPPADILAAQLAAISDDIVIDAVKIGMLANAEVIATVEAWLREARPPLVVLDPVMVSTSGHRLLDADAERALRALLPLADLVTPNLAELAVLADAEPAATWAEAIAQARTVAAEFGVRVLAKGGHLGGAEAPDALIGMNLDAADVVEFGGERIATTATHGTGCSLSSAVATLWARLGDPAEAVREARIWLRESLRHGESLQIGSGHGPIHHFAGTWARGGLETAPSEAELEESWWNSIADVRDDIDRLPFIAGLADGSLPRPVFEEYLAQDAHYLRTYARVLAEAASLAPDAEAQAFWANGAEQCLTGELELHRKGLAGRASATDFIPNAACTGYLDHLRSASARGGYGELIASVLPCYWLYDDLGRRLVGGGFGDAPLDPAHPYADWLAMYGEPRFSIATRQAIETVCAYASTATPEERARMHRAFRRAAEFERAFFAEPWDALVSADRPDAVAAGEVRS